MTPKTYYLSVTLINAGKQIALVNWIEHDGRKIYMDVYPQSQKTKEAVFTSVTKPYPVEITAIGKETNTSLLLNSKAVVTVTPKEIKETTTITIGEGLENSL